jgi:hypothetical protein
MPLIIFILLLPFIVVVLKAFFEACIQRRLIEPWRSRHFDGDASDWLWIMKRRDIEAFRTGEKMVQSEAQAKWLRKNLWFIGGCQWYSPFWFMKADYLNMARMANGSIDLILFTAGIAVWLTYVNVIGLSSPWVLTLAIYALLPGVKSLAYKFWFYSWLDKNGLSFRLWFRAFVLNRAKFVDGDRVVVPI